MKDNQRQAEFERQSGMLHEMDTLLNGFFRTHRGLQSAIDMMPHSMRPVYKISPGVLPGILEMGDPTATIPEPKNGLLLLPRESLVTPAKASSFAIEAFGDAYFESYHISPAIWNIVDNFELQSAVTEAWSDLHL